MPTPRVQKRIDALFEEIEAAVAAASWSGVRDLAQEVLDLDPDDADAASFLAAARRRMEREGPGESSGPASAAHERGEGFLSGRYVVRQTLGRLGRKAVYLAHDKIVERDVAFTTIDTVGLDAEATTRLWHDIRAIARLGEHPYIVTTYDVGDDNGTPYIVAQFMSGGSLADLMAESGARGIGVHRALQIATALVEALEFAHTKGVTHRDIKPGNIWFTAAGRPHLGDFGLTVGLDRNEADAAYLSPYSPPEEFRGEHLDPRSDVFSMGCVLFEMLTGRPPYTAPDTAEKEYANWGTGSIRRLNGSITLQLESLLRSLISPRPEDRPASAAAFHAELGRVSGAASPAEAPVAIPLTLGAPIFTRDSKQIGRVREVSSSGSFFKVDAPRRRDFWLSRDDVATADERRVTLAYRNDELAERQVEQNLKMGAAAKDGSAVRDEQSSGDGNESLRTLLFTDLESHTAMMQRLGDEKGRKLLRDHERMTREALREFGGSEVKTMGDGFLASFTSAQRALRCAISLQTALADYSAKGDETLTIRVGINAGEPIAEDEDLFGTAVILAARIASKAAGGEIFVANVVRELVAGKGFLFADRGEFPLRGFEEPMRVYELNWRLDA
ncbi:MAG: protein kinase [Chloroflexi bacterium]|nr:protein kinase [Chloroflexota bacterium]